MVTSSPTTALAAISWATDVLGFTDPAAFLAKAPSLLKYDAVALQRNLDSLQQALGWTTEQARQLVVKQPALLTYSPATVQAAVAWVEQLFPVAEQLAAVVDRGPMLVSRSPQHLQGNADYLRQALGWQDGDGQLAAYVAARPQDFALVNLYSEALQHKLRLLSEVVSVSTEECLTSGIGYLGRQLDNIAARYMLVQVRLHRQGSVALQHADSISRLCRPSCILIQAVASVATLASRRLECFGCKLNICCIVCIRGPPSTALHSLFAEQERAPALLRNNNDELHLSWIINANRPRNLRRLGMTRDEFNAFVKQWPRSEQGRRLLEGLRWARLGGLMVAAGYSVPARAAKPVQCTGMLCFLLASPTMPWHPSIHLQARQRGGLAAAALMAAGAAAAAGGRGRVAAHWQGSSCGS